MTPIPGTERISNNPTVVVPDHRPTIPPSYQGSVKKNQISEELLRKVYNLNFPDSSRSSSLEFKNHSKLSRSLLTDIHPRNGRISNNPTVLVPRSWSIPPSFRGSVKKNQISEELLRKAYSQNSSLEFKSHSKLSRSLLTDTHPRNGRISNNPTVAVTDHGPTIPPSFQGSVKKNQISEKLLRKV
ncbi:hypothetical protein CDAR_202981 [Caerostris darwini]|uniref:Uncharacterized protein n=1 Tax=Caerostris darwini TaxID=1538125 RepID=A0AAV4T1D8_9ARAC|nr:hypothetical protein CDAR_202981 [Caerostris darwini]